MKTQQQWFDEYAVSHQNKTNQIIHYICVPAIFFSIVGLLMSIPSQDISNLLLFTPNPIPDPATNNPLILDNTIPDDEIVAVFEVLLYPTDIPDPPTIFNTSDDL